MGNIPSRDRRKKSQRLQKGRDEFKARNREKAVQIKALQIKASDVAESRAQWKKKCEGKTREIKRLENGMATKDELIEIERRLRQQEAKAYVEELDSLKKKMADAAATLPGEKDSKIYHRHYSAVFVLMSLLLVLFRRSESSWSSGSIRSMLFLAPTIKCLITHTKVFGYFPSRFIL